MQIVVSSRDRVKNYIQEEEHAVISIRDPEGEKATFPPNPCRIAVLYLKFHDWDDKQKIKFEVFYEESAKQMIFFSKKDAKRIVKFVKKYQHLSLLICQCEAGISRSAGVAAALNKCINGSDEYYYKNYVPNSLVYRMVMNAWMEV